MFNHFPHFTANLESFVVICSRLCLYYGLYKTLKVEDGARSFDCISGGEMKRCRDGEGCSLRQIGWGLASPCASAITAKPQGMFSRLHGESLACESLFPRYNVHAFPTILPTRAINGSEMWKVFCRLTAETCHWTLSMGWGCKYSMRTHALQQYLVYQLHICTQ